MLPNKILFSFKPKRIALNQLNQLARVIQFMAAAPLFLFFAMMNVAAKDTVTQQLPFLTAVDSTSTLNDNLYQPSQTKQLQSSYLSAQADFTQDSSQIFDWLPLAPLTSTPDTQRKNQQERCAEAALLPPAQYDAAYRIYVQHGNLAAAKRITQSALQKRPSSQLWQNRFSEIGNQIQGIQAGTVINHQGMAVTTVGANHSENVNDININNINKRIGDACAPLQDYPYGGVRAAIGYSSNVGAFISGQYRHNNFLKRAWQWQLDGMVAQRRQSIASQLESPANDQAWRYRFSARYHRSRLEHHRIDSSQLAVLRLRQNDAFSYYFGLRYYHDALNIENRAQWRARSLAPTAGWQYQVLDRAVYPRQGITLDLQADVGLKSVLSTQDFFRTHGRAAQYIKVGKKNVALLRGEVGAVLAKGNAHRVPVSLLFYGGGVDSLRGANYQELGDKQNDVIYPAKYLLTAGAEWQNWFKPNFAVAAFYDAGIVTSYWPQRRFNHGVGSGIRWRTPIGAVNADIAFNIREKKWRPYLSFGATF